MPIECEHRDPADGTCRIAAELTGCGRGGIGRGSLIARVPAAEDACRACVNSQLPRQANFVTASLALVWIHRNAVDQFEESHKRLGWLLNRTVHPGGAAGTALAMLLRQLYLATEADCVSCLVHMGQMNEWGPAVCRERIDEIVGWLEESADSKGLSWLFRQWSARRLVQIAIGIAERKAGQGNGSAT